MEKQEKIIGHASPIFIVFAILFSGFDLWVETDASVLLASVENHKEEYLANQGSCIPGDDHIVLFFPPYREDCRFVFLGQNKRLVISSNQFSLSGSDVYIYLSDMINSHRIEVRKKIFVPLKHINTRVKK